MKILVRWIGCVVGVVVVLLVVPGKLVAESEIADEPLWPAEMLGQLLHDQAEETVNHAEVPNETGLDRSHALVSEPTLAIHRPTKTPVTDVGVIICPGGGYNEIWVDREGHNLAAWFAQQGITAAVLKYRTRPATMSWPEFFPQVLSDAAHAVRLLRSRASELGLDPQKIGMIGFSAGGHLIASLVFNADALSDLNDDPLAKFSALPDFVGLIYPGLADDMAKSVTAKTPPMFLINARDDQTTPVMGCIKLYVALLAKNIPAELHVFSTGGHGFELGLLHGGAPTLWPEMFMNWLGDIGIMKNR